VCAVIGIDGVVSTDLVRNIFLQSQIRGRHATGVSYLKHGKITTIKEPKPAEEFLDKHNPEDWYDGDRITMIGHCRYSTSDLQYNQPIANDEKAVVHNGVISQEMPENWEKLYGYKCETKNDSELLFHSWDVKKWPDASIAAIFLDQSGIQWARNGKRPLWISWNDDLAIVITSTKDIASRAGMKTIERVYYKGDDLQP